MSKLDACKKKLAGRITDEDIALFEETAAAFKNLEPEAAYVAAINAQIQALDVGRSNLINNILEGITKAPPRRGFAAAEEVKLEQVETKPIKPVEPKKPAKPKIKPKPKKPEPLFTKAPEQKIKDSIKGRMAQARHEQAVEGKTFTDEDLSQLKELMVELPVEEPTSTFTVKNREAAKRAINAATVEDSSIRKNKDGTYTVEIKTPDAATQAQDFDAPASKVIEQTSKVFDLGREVKDRQIKFIDTNKTVKKKGKPATNPLARANITEVVKLGAVLSGKPINYKKNLAKQVRDNLMEGLAYLQDKGYELETRKGNKLGLPGSTVVFGNNITLNNLAEVSKEIGELSRQLRTLEITSPREELFQEGKENELAEYYKEKRNITRELTKALDKYGISSEGETAFVPARDIISEQEKAQRKAELEVLEGRDRVILGREDISDESVMTEAEPLTFANLKPEYSGKGTKRQVSRAGLDNKVEAYTTSITEKEVNYTVDLLKHLGIKTNINFISEDNIQFMILGLEEQMKSDPKKREVYKRKVNELEKILIDRPLGRIIYFDEFRNVTDRVPVIFISKHAKGTKRVEILTHELGHLVQRVMLDQAPKETQSAIRKASGEMSESAFHEWFANQLLVWANSRAVPKGMLDKFFKSMALKLKELFNYLSNVLPLNETYAEFMDAMVSAEGQRTGGKPSRMRTQLGRKFESEILDIPTAGPYLMRSGMNQYADFTPMTPALSNLVQGMKIRTKKAFDKAAATKAGHIAGDSVKQVGESFIELHNAVIRSADAKLRAMKKPTTTWIADQWHTRSGAGRAPGHRTIPTEINQRGARWHSEIKRISQKVMPRKYNKAVDTIFGMEAGRLDKSSQAYQEIGNILVSEKLPDVKKLESKYGKEVTADIISGYNATRKYLDGLYDYLTNNLGLPIKRRKNYFPHALDVTAITEDKAEFIAILKAEGIGKNVQNMTQDQALEEFYQSLIMSDGTVMELGQDNKGDVLGPSFAGLSARVFEPALVQKLQKFYINDTMSVLTTYTHSAIKRGVIQKRFNPDNKMRADKRTNITKFDPLYELNERLDKAEKDYAAGLETGLSPEQVAATRKIIEAYLGRLGANMNPKLRNMSALMVTYQNMRLLSFVVLSSIVDAGLIDSRSGALFTSLKEAFRLVASTKSRNELYEAADMIGAIRDDITEHIVNDQQSMTYMSHKMKAGNEAFFRLVRMHQWTNLSRVMALSAGKQFMIKHANRPNSKQSQKYLKELGVTAEEVLSWGGDTTNMSANINTALHQFIDESVIRPSAAIRPDWASDPHWAIFFHLKQFMWGYHETILRRVWQQVKDNEGLYKVVPVMLLAAATLPLAAAGYELRRFLGGAPEYSDKKGGDYFWEVLQRSGAPGIMQLYVDADEAEEFGQFAPFAIAGPAVSQVTDFLNKDFDVALARSIPFVAQMPALRSWITSD